MFKNIWKKPAIYIQYTKIVLDAITDAKLKINKCKRNFMLEIFAILLKLNGRFAMINRSKYGNMRKKQSSLAKRQLKSSKRHAVKRNI
jgi:hypothetical protein